MHSNEVAIEDPAPDHQRQSKEYTPGAETAFGTAYGPPSDTFADLSPTPSRQEALRAQQAGIVPPMDLEQMRTEDTAYADYATSLNQPSDELRLPSRPIFRHYRRARSLSPPPAGQRRSSFPKGYARCPRHLSFSVAEDVVLPWEPIAEFDFEHETEGPIDDIDAEMATENLLVLELQQLNAKIRYLADVAGPWVESQLELAGKLDGEYQSKAEALTALYEKKLDNYRMLQINVAETTARESSSVAEEIKKVELLGAKLDYEISVLQSKVADVEAGLIDYESHVILIENRIRRVIGEARGTITRSAAGPGVGGDIDSHSGGGGSTWKLRKDWLAGLWTVVSATGT
ncbi:hypothetical protein KEM55_008154 [Ascosphaera atra]|nr:hypothetical protein KEM55_008154 [Ascosphaera atra]